MAVSKTCPAATVVEAAALGITLFGENRVQEFAAKASALAQLCEPTLPPQEESPFVSGHDFSRAVNVGESRRALAPEVCVAGPALAASFGFAANAAPIRVHLIGHLQSNKALRAAELFDGIDSLDSPRLAERLNEAAARLGKRLPVLIEVKLSPEAAKTGLEPESAEAEALLERLPDLEHLEARGLMTIPPFGVPDDATRACFRGLRQWRDRWAAAHPKLALEVLSMGMSGDFELAIAEGATRIRIGTALFGPRRPKGGWE
jgi:hypothetical protein